jgi:hypothetical protein
LCNTILRGRIYAFEYNGSPRQLGSGEIKWDICNAEILKYDRNICYGGKTNSIEFEITIELLKDIKDKDIIHSTFIYCIEIGYFLG